jgi:VanZ family protein
MNHRVLAVAGWASLALIIYATLCPLGSRPKLTNVHFEHFGAFAVSGLILAVAYPRHLGLVVLIVISCALTLELLQLFTPDRHGRVIDASFKAAGGLAGVGIGWLVYQGKIAAENLRGG